MAYNFVNKELTLVVNMGIRGPGHRTLPVLSRVEAKHWLPQNER
jgi:hypothetical protein